MALAKGNQVTFHRSHDTVHELSGEVVEVADDGQVLVKTEPDGVLVWTDEKHAKVAKD